MRTFIYTQLTWLPSSQDHCGYIYHRLKLTLISRKFFSDLYFAYTICNTTGTHVGEFHSMMKVSRLLSKRLIYCSYINLSFLFSILVSQLQIRFFIIFDIWNNKGASIMRDSGLETNVWRGGTLSKNPKAYFVVSLSLQVCMNQDEKRKNLIQQSVTRGQTTELQISSPNIL